MLMNNLLGGTGRQAGGSLSVWPPLLLSPRRFQLSVLRAASCRDLSRAGVALGPFRLS